MSCSRGAKAGALDVQMGVKGAMPALKCWGIMSSQFQFSCKAELSCIKNVHREKSHNKLIATRKPTNIVLAFCLM